MYSDVLCKNVCFLNRFLGILCSSLHINGFLQFKEERCTTAYTNVGEILIATTLWHKIYIANSLRNTETFRGITAGHFKVGKLWLFLESTCDITNMSQAKLWQYISDALSTEPKFVLRDDHDGSCVGRNLLIFRHLHTLVIVGCV